MSRSTFDPILDPAGTDHAAAAETLTETLELQIQGLMDTLGPGRPLPESALVSAPSRMPVPQPAS